MTSHEINYKGLELEVFGTWEDPEYDIGDIGGWATDKIKLNDIDIFEDLNDYAKETIARIVYEEFYK